MIRLSRNNLLIGAITLCCILVAAKTVHASISTIKGKGKFQTPFFFVSNTLTNASNTDAVTVPAGQTLVITDFVFSNSFGGVNGLVMQKQKVDLTTTNLIPFTNAPVSMTISHAFSTGIELSAGEHLILRTVNGISGVSVNGYFKK